MVVAVAYVVAVVEGKYPGCEEGRHPNLTLNESERGMYVGECGGAWTGDPFGQGQGSSCCLGCCSDNEDPWRGRKWCLQGKTGSAAWARGDVIGGAT